MDWCCSRHQEANKQLRNPIRKSANLTTDPNQTHRPRTHIITTWTLAHSIEYLHTHRTYIYIHCRGEEGVCYILNQLSFVSFFLLSFFFSLLVFACFHLFVLCSDLTLFSLVFGFPGIGSCIVIFYAIHIHMCLFLRKVLYRRCSL